MPFSAKFAVPSPVNSGAVVSGPSATSKVTVTVSVDCLPLLAPSKLSSVAKTLKLALPSKPAADSYSKKTVEPIPTRTSRLRASS